MRLDKFLKVSRIIKRRTLAKEFCDAERVYVNDKIVKASQKVDVNDIIKIVYGNRETKFKILKIQDTVKKDEAKDLYEEVK